MVTINLRAIKTKFSMKYLYKLINCYATSIVINNAMFFYENPQIIIRASNFVNNLPLPHNKL